MKMDIKLTYGESIALTILAAKELGGDFGFTEQCENLLNKQRVAPSYLGWLEKEARIANQWVINNNLVFKANKIVDRILNQGSIKNDNCNL